MKRLSFGKRMVLGGLLYTTLTLLLLIIFHQERDARFYFNMVIGLTGIMIGCLSKFIRPRRRSDD